MFQYDLGVLFEILSRGFIRNNLSTSLKVVVWIAYILPSPDLTLWKYTRPVVAVVIVCANIFHSYSSGVKWPFSSMTNLATQHENTLFQNYKSTPIVSNYSRNPSLNNYLLTKDPQYFGGTFPLVTSTSNSRKNYDHLRPNLSTLTIFYMGEVHIFQDISPEKAELIIDVASKSTTLHMNEILEKVMNKEKSEENKSEPSNASTDYVKGALAMARRATLARFLEKRKHRLIKARPYQYDEKIPKFPFDLHQEEEETASSSCHWES